MLYTCAIKTEIEKSPRWAARHPATPIDLTATVILEKGALNRHPPKHTNSVRCASTESSKAWNTSARACQFKMTHCTGNLRGFLVSVFNSLKQSFQNFLHVHFSLIKRQMACIDMVGSWIFTFMSSVRHRWPNLVLPDLESEFSTSRGTCARCHIKPYQGPRCSCISNCECKFAEDFKVWYGRQ